MDAEQIELARHALGLGNGRACSYRNHFVAGPGHADYANWMRMVDVGDAVRFEGKRYPFGGDDLFRLTEAGAIKAIRAGERLDPEDFQSLPSPAQGK